MRLKLGIGDYDMPPFSYLESVVMFTGGDPRLDPRGLAISIPEVSCSTIEIHRQQNPEFRDRPDIFSVDRGNGKIMFYPVPDKDYEVKIRFAGPIQEI